MNGLQAGKLSTLFGYEVALSLALGDGRVLDLAEALLIDEDAIVSVDLDCVVRLLGEAGA